MDTCILISGILVLWSAAAVSALQKEPFLGLIEEGQMTPIDPLVETGTTLELNCTLSDKYNGAHTADDITFRLANQTYDSQPYVTVLDLRTAMLRLPNVQRTISGKHIFCYVPDVPHQIGQQVITVADRPEMPRLTGCVVYNWKSMTCTWEPAKQDTGIPTDTQLYWTVFDNKVFKCPHPADSSCTFIVLDKVKGNYFRVDQVYYFLLHANNSIADLKTDCSNVTQCRMKTKYIVQPGNISTLGLMEPAKSDSLRINWTSPLDSDSNRVLRFQVSWCAEDKQFGGYLNCSHKNTSVNKTTLKNLTPFTRYKVKVKSIPIFEVKGCRKYSCYEAKGFWSHVKEEELQTKEDVPAKAPETTEGGFTFTDSLDVKLYWKKVPRYHANGYITHYIINSTLMNDRLDKSELQTVASGQDSSISMTLRKNFVYKFFVDARTTEGFNTSLTHEPIIISTMEGAKPKKPELFSTITHRVEDEDHVVFNWTLVPGAVGYTLFWCKGTYHDCTKEINWDDVSNETTNYTLVLENDRYYNYIFGLSTNSETTMAHLEYKRSKRSSDSLTVSSGIEWSDCAHEAAKEVLAPTKFAFSEHQEPSTLRVEWQHPKCTLSGFILNYYVFYCMKDNCEEPKKQMVSRDMLAYTLTDLEGDKDYNVWIRSASTTGELSKATKVITQQVGFSGLRKGAIAGIAIVVVVVFIVAAFGLVHCCGKIKKRANVYKGTHADLPPEMFPSGMPNMGDDDDDEPMVQDDSFFHTTSSGGSWMQGENLRNLARESQLSDGTVTAGLDLVDEEGNRVQSTPAYVNGVLGAKDLGGVRFEKKQSADGSVSSMETLTTPLSVDLSRDSQDEMFRSARNRNMSGGSNLNPVPESPAEDPENAYYNTSESSSIGSYNKVGFEHDPRAAHDSTNSSENSSPLPAPLLCSVEGTNYHTISSPETSPTRPGPSPGRGKQGAAGKKPRSPIAPQSPTEPSEYDVPSMISPYSKVNCVDFPLPDYDSSAGSFASTDTVIDTFKNKKPPAPPPTDDYVSQGFMQTMASNTSLNLSESSDIEPYSKVGERESSPESTHRDAYLDDDMESDESQPLCLDLGLPTANCPDGYVQSPPPIFSSQNANSDSSDYVQAPPPPVTHTSPSNNAYVLAPPMNNGLYGAPQTDSNYVPHPSVNGTHPSSSFHDTDYVQSTDVSKLSNNNKGNKPCQNGPTLVNGYGGSAQQTPNGDDSGYLPHSMTMGNNSPAPHGSKNTNSGAFPSTNSNSPKISSPQESDGNSGYISPDFLDSIGSSRSNGLPATDVQSNNSKPTVNDSYVSIDSVAPPRNGLEIPTTNGIEDSVSEGSSDQEGDYTNNVGMMGQNNGYVAHVTC